MAAEITEQQLPSEKTEQEQPPEEESQDSVPTLSVEHKAPTIAEALQMVVKKVPSSNASRSGEQAQVTEKDKEGKDKLAKYCVSCAKDIDAAADVDT